MTEGPAHRRRALVASTLVLVLALSACTAPFGRRTQPREGADEAGLPLPELGLPATPLPIEGEVTTTVPTSSGSTTSTTRAGSPGTTTTVASGGTTTTTIPDTYRSVATATDLRGDHGPEGPAYADLLRLTVDRGTRTMRFTIEVAGGLPAALAAAEVEGIGIDLYRGATTLESAYQVFVDGGSDGWRAYLQVGTTFVQYPGTFRLGGNRLELVVPLEAFADGAPERASAFADWSSRASGTNRSSEDHVPTLGTVTIER